MLLLLMTDVDECVERTGVCMNADCVNTNGGFRCNCNAGYKLTSTGDTCIGEF